jgi:hypothetical protein
MVYEKAISGIYNFNGGRVNCLVPTRLKPFSKISSGILSNMIEFFDMKSQFSIFRLISKKFNQCFEEHLHYMATNSVNIIN